MVKRRVNRDKKFSWSIDDVEFKKNSSTVKGHRVIKKKKRAG